MTLIKWIDKELRYFFHFTSGFLKKYQPKFHKKKLGCVIKASAGDLANEVY